MKKIVIILLTLSASVLTGCGSYDTTAPEPQYESSSSEVQESANVKEENNTSETNIAAYGADKEVMPDEYLGEWECVLDNEYAVLNIDESNGTYSACLIIGSTPEKYMQWYYILKFKDGKMVCDGDDTYWEIDESKIDNNYIDVSSDLQYCPNQSAEFSLSPEGIIWNDITGNRGNNIVFS